MNAIERSDPRELHSDWQRGYEQSPPGEEDQMRPLADHGEESNRGSERLEDLLHAHHRGR